MIHSDLPASAPAAAQAADLGELEALVLLGWYVLVSARQSHAH